MTGGDRGRLARTVAVVALDPLVAEAAARRLAAEGAAVVVVARPGEGERAGAVLARAEADGRGRAASWHLEGDPDDAGLSGLVELIGELFPDRGGSAGPR